MTEESSPSWPRNCLHCNRSFEPPASEVWWCSPECQARIPETLKPASEPELAHESEGADILDYARAKARLASEVSGHCKINQPIDVAQWTLGVDTMIGVLTALRDVPGGILTTDHGYLLSAVEILLERMIDAHGLGEPIEEDESSE